MSRPSPISPPDSPPDRRVPEIPFPTYRFVPGLQTHPNLSRDHGFPEISLDECWDYGWDLYTHHFWWEAHEVWERLWKAVPLERSEEWSVDHPQRRFIQGHILLSASKLLEHMGRPKPAMIEKAQRYLQMGDAFDSTQL